ncbi:hypothetical protein IWW36_004713 [Coemansia brasiliensis]|uniref:Myb-like domain-containing protein n=1 Tax=Coemansia brasiliensis TaxID=2650707 RepID=A0A9W8I2T6_9FUNG|nr:hypothetical protein IWW36_004713 [Coemansia brasiliensis]
MPKDELLHALAKEMPLCLESDISACISQCFAKLHSPTVIPSHHAKPHFNTEDPRNEFSSNWTQSEDDLLALYISQHKGRKNWVDCAKIVATKSSSQCKSRYNNNKQKFVADDLLV